MYRLEAALTHQMNGALILSLQQENQSFHETRIKFRPNMFYRITPTANVQSIIPSAITNLSLTLKGGEL